MASFATRLRTDRVNAGLTVRQLAERSHISFSYITKIETARAGKGISPEVVTTLAKALDKDELDYLHISGVVPAPLSNLLADERSRCFVRALLGSRQTCTGWSRLETALSESKAAYSVLKKKPDQGRVAGRQEVKRGD